MSSLEASAATLGPKQWCVCAWLTVAAALVDPIGIKVCVVPAMCAGWRCSHQCRFLCSCGCNLFSLHMSAGEVCQECGMNCGRFYTPHTAPALGAGCHGCSPAALPAVRQSHTALRLQCLLAPHGMHASLSSPTLAPHCRALPVQLTCASVGAAHITLPSPCSPLPPQPALEC